VFSLQSVIPKPTAVLLLLSTLHQVTLIEAKYPMLCSQDTYLSPHATLIYKATLSLAYLYEPAKRYRNMLTVLSALLSLLSAGQCSLNHDTDLFHNNSRCSVFCYFFFLWLRKVLRNVYVMMMMMIIIIIIVFGKERILNET
jgi:hypothetical protein